MMTNSISIQQRIIGDDKSLLQLMLDDAESVPAIYKPGPYWLMKSKISANEIKKYGLDDFRGSSNSIATSYADNIHVDIRHQLNSGLRKPLGVLLNKVYPFSRIFDTQVNLTRGYAKISVALKNEIANNSQQIKDLLSQYTLPADTLRGGCLDFCEIDGIKISNFYLGLLGTHNSLARHVDFSSARSFFEIGGGFGANMHILIENYKNIRKYVYLDISPNLYTGTMYLKSFYGDSVKSYRETRNLKKISFSNTDELEILCIAPHQIEYLDMQIDIFQNSRSFVEMPEDIVRNYASHIERMLNPERSFIALVCYDQFSANTTLNPDKLAEFFSRPFERYEESELLNFTNKNYLYISSYHRPNVTHI